MGCDETTFSALNLALMNSMEPETGSVLLFLMAAPGETEFFLRRPGDDLPERWELNLGSSTWFNEPVLRALLFLAPFIEQLLPEMQGEQSWTNASSATADEVGSADVEQEASNGLEDQREEATLSMVEGRGSTSEAGSGQLMQAPIQIICLTDGQDNMSAKRYSKFNGFVNAMKKIRAPQAGTSLFQPMVPGEKVPPPAPNPGGSVGKIPVWLCWIAVGLGGQSILEDASRDAPPVMLFIDAVATPAVRSSRGGMKKKNIAAGPTHGSAASACGSGGAGGPSSRGMVDDPFMSIPAASGVARKTAIQHFRDKTQAVKVASNMVQIEAKDWATGARVKIKPEKPGQPDLAATILQPVPVETYSGFVRYGFMTFCTHVQDLVSIISDLRFRI